MTIFEMNIREIDASEKTCEQIKSRTYPTSLCYCILIVKFKRFLKYKQFNKDTRFNS